MRQPDVHISEIKAYLRCKLAGYWSAPPPRGLGLEPIVSSLPLYLGRLIHQALQIGYDTGVPFAEAFEKLCPEDNALGIGMLKGYQDWAKQHDQGVRFLATETSWGGVPLGGRIKLAGRFDAVVQRSDGIWVLDFKTTSSSYTDWTMQDLQATAYVHAARKLYGPKVRGILFRFLLKKEPLTFDKLILKNGTVTQRKSLPKETTYKNYLTALAVATLRDLDGQGELLPEPPFHSSDLGNYADLLDGTQKEQLWYPAFSEAFLQVRRMYYTQLQNLKGRNHFFWEVEEYRTDEQVRNYIKHVLYPTAKEMTSRRKGKWIGPTGLGAAYAICSNCAFKIPCKLCMDGADFRSVLRTEYQLRKEEKNEA